MLLRPTRPHPRPPGPAPPRASRARRHARSRDRRRSTHESVSAAPERYRAPRSLLRPALLWYLGQFATHTGDLDVVIDGEALVHHDTLCPVGIEAVVEGLQTHSE